MAPLPPKEAALFKSILKHYETKQYKKGVRAADQVLKKFPDHGETLSMKGLILNCLEKKQEAYQYVRNGLKQDLRSHVSWHVFGLLHRSDKNYEEAIKCYRNALKHDPDNLQILRDLSLLQMQMRDLEGFKNTRHELLRVRPQQRASWIGLSMAYHLLKKYDVALGMLDSFEDSLMKVDSSKGETSQVVFVDYEDSEMLLYKYSLMMEAGKYSDVFADAKKNCKRICDKIVYLELQAQVLTALGRKADAIRVYEVLIKKSPDNLSYYFGYELASGTIDAHGNPTQHSDSYLSKRIQQYDTWAQRFPRAQTPLLHPLKFLPAGDEFRKRATRVIRKMIQKGIPSLFSSLKNIYTDNRKREIIQEIVEDILKDSETTEKDSCELPPSSQLWAYYFLAQYFLHIGNSHQSMKFINDAIEHTPTLVDLYLFKAHILYSMGDYDNAASTANNARELDTADRFLNSECAKFMIRANDISQATSIVGLFSREGADQVDNLVEMQCMWFQLECGFNHYHQKQYGKALKRFHRIEKHFSEITDDQFDFHTYCMRKLTLRSYVKLLRLEDSLREHEFYYFAALGAIQCYLDLFDNPDYQQKNESQAASELGSESSNLTDKEMKKLRSKLRRAELRAQNEPSPSSLSNPDHVDSKEASAAQAKKANPKKNASKQVEDTDPDGLELLKAEKPLDEAVKFLTPLTNLCSSKIETHLSGYEIFKRRGKFLLCLRDLKRAKKIDSIHPVLHKNLIEFHSLVHGCKDMDNVVKLFLQDELKLLLDGVSPIEYNEMYLKNVSKKIQQQRKHSSPLCIPPQLVDSNAYIHPFPYVGSYDGAIKKLLLASSESTYSICHLLVYAEMMHFLNPAKKKEALKLLTGENSLLSKSIANHGCNPDLWECTNVYRSLKTVFNVPSEAARFQQQTLKFFPDYKRWD